MTANCTYEFPDIYQKLPGTHDPDHDRIKAQNELNGRIYRAARFLLVRDFHAPEALPHHPHDFPGQTLADADIAQMAGVHGILVTDGWDPAMGKTQPASDDVFVTADQIKASYSMVIDRRFVDAVVAAVQEYTAATGLFQQCFAYLKQNSTISSKTSAATTT